MVLWSPQVRHHGQYDIKEEYINQYSNLKYGGWYLPLCDADGNDINFTQVKPFNPRSYKDKDGKIKTIKYENPPCENAAPIIPSIKDKSCLDFIVTSLNKRYHDLLIEKTGKLLDSNNKEDYKLKGPGIDLVYHWARINEIIDVGLLDCREIVYDILTNMGCEITTVNMSIEEQKSIKDNISIIKTELNQIKEKKIFKHCNQVKKAEKITKEQYDSLKKHKAVSKFDRLSMEKYDYEIKLGDELMDRDDSHWAIIGDKTKNAYSRLRLEYILRDYDIALRLDAINNNKSRTDYDGTKYTLMSLLYKYLKVFKLIDSNEEYSNNSPLIQEIVTCWNEHSEEIKRVTGLHLAQDWQTNPIRCLGRLLKKVGYRFEECYKNNDERHYRIVRDFYKPIYGESDNAILLTSTLRLRANGKFSRFDYLIQDEIDLILVNIAQKIKEHIEANEIFFLGEKVSA